MSRKSRMEKATKQATRAFIGFVLAGLSQPSSGYISPLNGTNPETNRKHLRCLHTSRAKPRHGHFLAPSNPVNLLGLRWSKPTPQRNVFPASCRSSRATADASEEVIAVFWTASRICTRLAARYVSKRRFS